MHTQVLSAKILPDGIVIPKVESAQHVEYVDAALVRLLGAERAKDIIIIALIESVEGMVSEANRCCMSMYCLVGRA